MPLNVVKVTHLCLQALVRLTLRPVNPSDIFTVNGVYPGFQPQSMPAVPGLKVSVRYSGMLDNLWPFDEILVLSRH